MKLIYTFFLLFLNLLCLEKIKLFFYSFNIFFWIVLYQLSSIHWSQKSITPPFCITTGHLNWTQVDSGQSGWSLQGQDYSYLWFHFLKQKNDWIFWMDFLPFVDFLSWEIFLLDIKTLSMLCCGDRGWELVGWVSHCNSSWVNRS